MVKRIKEQPDKFYLILEPEMVNVCFWYIPTRLRKVAHSPAREVELGKVRIINRKMFEFRRKLSILNFHIFFLFALFVPMDVFSIIITFGIHHF